MFDLLMQCLSGLTFLAASSVIAVPSPDGATVLFTERVSVHEIREEPKVRPETGVLQNKAHVKSESTRNEGSMRSVTARRRGDELERLRMYIVDRSKWSGR